MAVEVGVGFVGVGSPVGPVAPAVGVVRGAVLWGAEVGAADAGAGRWPCTGDVVWGEAAVPGVVCRV